jgi:hypothetical protein
VVDITNTTASSSTSTGALTVDGGLGVAADVWIGDDLNLDSDSAVLGLGADQDVLVTHVADTGINLTTTANTSGTFNLGNDDDSNDDSIDLVLHDGGQITLYDANDDTTETITVTDGGGTTFTSTAGSINLNAQANDQDVVFNVDDGGTDWSVTIDGSEGTVTIGDGDAFDHILQFDASATDGTITYDEDPGEFQFNEDIDIASGKVYKINDSQINIGNLAAGGDWTPTGTIDFSSTTDTTYKDDTIDAADIDTINCGTNCTWDATNDEIDVDDAFLTNNAADSMTAAAPGLTLEDSDDAAGTGELVFASANTQDIVGSIKVDVAGSATSYMEIDGVTETVDVLKPLVLDSIDTSGAADIDIGSADVTDVTILTDGGADSLTIGGNADADYGITFDSDNNDLTILWEEDNAELEIKDNTADHEELVIDLDTATDNEIGIGTTNPSGVTQLSFGALNMVTTGSIAGRIPIGTTITGNQSLNTSDLHGKFYMVTAACTITLDAASDAGYGASVMFFVRDGTETVIIEIDGSDKINLDGSALDAGDTIDSPGSAGDWVTLMSVTDTDGSGTDGWLVLGKSGTWTDGGAT